MGSIGLCRCKTGTMVGEAEAMPFPKVTGTMLEESKELLRLFGIPYIVAPMEAEAPA